MADNMHDFFEGREEWTGQESPIPTTAPPPPPPSRRQMRQVRELDRRRQLISRLIVIGVVAVVVICVLITGNYIRHADPRIQPTKTVAADYRGPGTGQVEFTIESGQGVDIIARNLVNAGVVKSTDAFVQALANASASTKLQPGTFELKSHMPSAQVVTILTDPKQAGGFLQVRAGDRARDVIARAAQISGINKADFDAIVSSGGAGILPAEAAGNFEGWLEPGTYNVKSMKSAQQILQTVVDKRVSKLDALGIPKGADRERILNLASITEAEVNKPEYYGKVVRVIDNRLARGMTLGMDSTVAYSNNVSALKLTNDMLNDSSDPYNTRVHQGLPPTPIGNAGDQAIRAAMNPEQGDWLYFVTVNLDTGETKFTASSQEFDAFVQEYKAWEAQHNG
ncbi:hypothetical protein KIM372_08560 [Bombiscardovia nodaiensis]|uniref:Endolytic murein transglycosylase n=1 Tax=Bombiscardovia nodaiensis TaxID=2932181 RepID=A0ABM8B7V6_9BIFI|nr:hypothetical protein KIM372_08560 [Bombiscardovia nodaiensis]